MRKRWLAFIGRHRRVQALRHRWFKFQDGIRYALGIGPIGVNTTCPACEREIEVEAE